MEFLGWPTAGMAPAPGLAPFGAGMMLQPRVLEPIADRGGEFGTRPRRIDEILGTQSMKKRGRFGKFEIGQSKVHFKYPMNGKVALLLEEKDSLSLSNAYVRDGELLFRIMGRGRSRFPRADPGAPAVYQSTADFCASNPLLSLYQVNRILLEAADFEVGRDLLNGSAVAKQIRLVGVKVTPGEAGQTGEYESDISGMDDIQPPTETVALRGYCQVRSPWVCAEVPGSTLYLRLVLVKFEDGKLCDPSANEATFARFERDNVEVADYPNMEKLRWQLVPYTETHADAMRTVYCGGIPTETLLSGECMADADRLHWTGALIRVGYTCDQPKAQIGGGRQMVYPCMANHSIQGSDGASERRDTALAKMNQPLINIALQV